MKRYLLYPVLAAIWMWVPEYTTTGQARVAVRLAFIGLQWPEAAKDSQAARLVERNLAEALTRDSRVMIIDGSQTRPALAGVGYDGSINLSNEEARRVGSAMGCDFFIIGKAETLT